MRTIEEISEHFAVLNNLLESSWEGREDEIEYEHIFNACKQTAEYIQKWIPVSESKPKNFSCVLVKEGSDSPVRSIALYQDDTFYPDFLLEDSQITHWRLID